MEGTAAVSARDVIFNSIRSALAVNGREAPRRKEVADRLSGHPGGIVPERGHLALPDRVRLFIRMLTDASGTCDVVASGDDVPGAVGNFLRTNNLPLALRRGGDPRLAALPWDREPMLDITTGASDGTQLTAISHAFAAVAETGTLVLTAGPDNPTTLNFLPDNHLVVLNAADLDGDFETVLARLREKFGAGVLPRVVNLVTGPSRSADIEQRLILGAHGPRRLHVVIVGGMDELNH
jgi:L-lactate dehydrogenase complex protein LldG